MHKYRGCIHYTLAEYIAVNSSLDQTCNDGTIHLVGSKALSRGRVIYCYEGDWYSVCATDWGREEARVICKTLGYDTTSSGYVAV